MQQLEQGDAHDQFRLAYSYKLGLNSFKIDPERSLVWYQRAAENGDARAQAELGYRYQDGDGVAQDREKALAWFKKAADQGNDDDYLRYVNVTYSRNSLVIKDAATEGRPPAQYALARDLLQYKNADEIKESVFWLRKAAEHGDAFAQNYLGVLFSLGKGVAKDYQQAAVWTKRAAEQGNINAQYRAGMDYLSGRGVPKSPTESLHWFLLAAERGDQASMNRLNDAIQGGKALARDIEHGSSDAQYLLGFAYENSIGPDLSQQTRLAAYWYQRAADQGHTKAKARLMRLNRDMQYMPRAAGADALSTGH